MAARKRKSSAARGFDAHPVRLGVEAGAYACFQAALELMHSSQGAERDNSTIRKLFRDGRDLFRWLSPPFTDLQRKESVLSTARKLLSHESLSVELKMKGLQTITKSPRGRPADSKHSVIFALEAKLAFPEMGWKQITPKFCPCTKREHDSCCVDNLESQIARLKTLIRRTGILPLISRAARGAAFKRNLHDMFGLPGPV